MEQEQQEIINDVIALHPHLLQKLMKEGKAFQNLLCLYTFYLYHAQLQKTNKILATNDFVHHNLGWCVDKIKKTKRRLKELGLIEVNQRGYYSYIHLIYIYTKKKIVAILQGDDGIVKEPVKKEDEALKTEETKKETKEPPKEQEKSLFVKVLEEHKVSPLKVQFIRQNLIDLQAKNPINFNPLALAKWIGYCDKEEINFSKKNLHYWIKKMEKPTSIEQLEAVEYAIEQKWKNFYTKDSKTSPYQKYLGKSIMIDKFCDTLYDVLKDKEKFVYKFKNITLKIEMPIDQLFKEYEYTPNKTIIPKIKSLLGFTKKM